MISKNPLSNSRK